MKEEIRFALIESKQGENVCCFMGISRRSASEAPHSADSEALGDGNEEIAVYNYPVSSRYFLDERHVGKQESNG